MPGDQEEELGSMMGLPRTENEQLTGVDVRTNHLSRKIADIQFQPHICTKFGPGEIVHFLRSVHVIQQSMLLRPEFEYMTAIAKSGTGIFSNTSGFTCNLRIESGGVRTRVPQKAFC